MPNTQQNASKHPENIPHIVCRGRPRASFAAVVTLLSDNRIGANTAVETLLLLEVTLKGLGDNDVEDDVGNWELEEPKEPIELGNGDGDIRGMIDMQIEAFTVLNVPEGQILQPVQPASENVLTLQGKHVIAPEYVPNEPGGQLMQMDAPEVLENVPRAAGGGKRWCVKLVCVRARARARV